MSQVNTSTAAIDPAVAQVLHAGPIRVKFIDGELRYLRVGEKEIARRIYFGVRDANWNTAMPKFTKVELEKADDHFTIHLAADCRMQAIDYSWTAAITGTAEGKITCAVTGVANADFDSNRIGLCVLFGAGSLAGQAFETDGTVAKGEFPRLLASTLVASKFHNLSYTTASGLNVACSLDGATFDMEDQRNWGDSSWKAYAPLPYAYKQVGKGDARTETVTLSATNTGDAKPIAQDPVHFKLGPAMEGAHVPEFAALPTAKVADFPAVSFSRDKFKEQRVVAWSYIPTTHLPDEDVIMENLPAIADQARTVRGFNKDCVMQVGPLGLSTQGAEDPRADQPLAAAWAVGMVKYLAAGGVDEASFAVGGGVPTAALDAVRPYARQKVLTVETEPADPHHFVAFAAENDKGVAMFIVNHTSHPCHAVVDAILANASVLRIAPGAADTPVSAAGPLKLELAPFEVVRITAPK